MRAPLRRRHLRRAGRWLLRPLTFLLVVLGGLLAVGRTTAAQETRAEALAQQQRERAARVAPYEPSRAERIITRLENSVLGVAPVGPYPWIGSIYPTGWIGLGAGYRTVFSDTGSANVMAGWSLRNFKTTQGTLTAPEIAGGLVRLGATAAWIDAPAVPFYGVGHSTSPEDRTRFSYRETSLGARADIAPARWLSLGLAVDHLRLTTGGTGSDDSVERRFDPAQAPGVLADPRYLRTGVSAAVDWRQPPGYSGTGGLYRAELTDYAQQDAGLYDFRQFEAEVVQLVPILRANWVLAVRGMVTITETDDGHDVPFFLLPSLGGSRNVRGYSTFRFRDRHRILWSAEYRWTPARFLDMALFYDAGKVTSRRSDLDFSGLSDAYGIGVRVVSLAGTALRVEVAHSRESRLHLILTSSASF